MAGSISAIGLGAAADLDAQINAPVPTIATTVRSVPVATGQWPIRRHDERRFDGDVIGGKRRRHPCNAVRCPPLS